MTELNEIQKKLAEQLLLSVKNKESIVEYSELAVRIDPPIHWRQVGRNIGEISKLCYELGLPLLSAKVVNKSTKKAGEGFYTLYESLGIPTDNKKERELYRQEREAIRTCKEWYKLEDYLGLNIGFEHPEIKKPVKKAKPEFVDVFESEGNSSSAPNIQSDGTEISIENAANSVPDIYLNPDIHFFSVKNPTPFRHSVDVLNYGFGSQYVKSFKKGWQQAAFYFNTNETAYMVWFPKISTNGRPASSSGWLNTIYDDGNTIIEKAPDKDPDLGYNVSDSIRIVFAKIKDGPYLFTGVFLPDKEKSSYRYHVYTKVAEKADFSGSIPVIHYFKREEEDKDLISELKNDTLTGAPQQFQYKGKPKEKALPVEISGHKIYPREKQVSINALSHAGYLCEIDNSHTTFLRRNSCKPYTEPHHLIPMSFSDEFQVSLDVEENIVSLCSNCHNHIHYGQGAEELLKKLFYDRQDALKKVGIDISFNQLLEYYK